MKFITCINCGTDRELKHTTTTANPNKYCGRSCQTEYFIKTEQLSKFYSGEIHGRPSLKKILTYLFGYKCVDCGNKGEYNGKPLVLQLDHIDGNSTNDMPENVRLLCPNCHSQTPTFTAKNKGNGRRVRTGK